MNPHLIKKPIITEKTMSLANEQNVYSFYVDRGANKNQIKAAIEKLYEVKVLSVNTMINPSYLKRTGRKRLMSFFERTKKALVKLKDGDTIELFEVSN